MLRAIPLLVVLLVLAAAVVLVITPAQQPRSERHNRRPSGSASTGLVVLGMLAVGVAVALGFGAGDAWPLLPIAIWIAIYLALREWARTRPQRERAKAQQKMQAKRRRVDEFGADGVQLMDRADAAVRRIMSSEAATQGWLGELDFTGDVSMIADTLRKVTALRTAAAEWAAIPNATADDDRMLRDAQRAAAKLKTAAAERVKVLHDCSLQAEQVDQTPASATGTGGYHPAARRCPQPARCHDQRRREDTERSVIRLDRRGQSASRRIPRAQGNHRRATT